jgi:hypothetical protein
MSIKFNFTSATTSFTTLTVPQKTFIERHLRGTQRSLSEPQAVATFGIQNLRARISEMRAAGLDIRTEKNTKGNTSYRMVCRDVTGSRAKVFA